MGYLLIDSISTRNDPVIMGTTLFVVFGNLLVDLGYGLADPRVRSGA